MPTTEQTDSQQRRTVTGTVWRTLVTLVASTAAIAAGAWLASRLVGYDDRLASVPTVPAGFAVGVLTIGWLRARTAFIAVPLLGTLVAGQAGAFLLHGGALAGGRLRLSSSGMAAYEQYLLAAGTAAVLVSVVVAAVSGHRSPREPQEAAGPGEAQEATAPGPGEAQVPEAEREGPLR
ncbi:hypothetical protein [Peterkaempfera griseoplana]|uniref:hypothetical protein n=1 Tax=Peterkaempfera griseoplana TaxID=66896 RepID=UPI0006E3B98E|nr:hypothetical protein [Peterkaempfera griseoplana]